MISTTKPNSLRAKVAHVLGELRGERMHLVELAEKTGGLASAVKEAVYKLRDAGMPICSASDGERSVYYYISAVDYENKHHAKRPRAVIEEKPDAPLVLDFDPFEVGGR